MRIQLLLQSHPETLMVYPRSVERVCFLFDRFVVRRVSSTPYNNVFSLKLDRFKLYKTSLDYIEKV